MLADSGHLTGDRSLWFAAQCWLHARTSRGENRCAPPGKSRCVICGIVCDTCRLRLLTSREIPAILPSIDDGKKTKPH